MELSISSGSVAVALTESLTRRMTGKFIVNIEFREADLAILVSVLRLITHRNLYSWIHAVLRD